MYENQAKYPEALQMHKEAPEICLRIFGPDHLVVAGTLRNIALVHQKQGRHDFEAECFDKCVVIYEKVYGNEHSETADARKEAARARA